MVSMVQISGLVAATYGRAATGAPAATPAKAPDKTSDEDSVLEQVKSQARTAKKAQIGDAKSNARARIQRLLEQLKLLKKLYADDPKQMAHALAAAAKELQGAVKDYGAAAKDSAAMFGEDFQNLPDASTDPDAAASARKDLEAQAKSEAAGDMDFIKFVRSIGNDLRDTLTTARTKATLTMKEKFEESDDYKDADKGLKDLSKSVDDLDQQVRTDMPPGSLMTLAA